MAFNPIITDGFKVAPLTADLGAVPALQWLDIADLVVDASYQRPIGRVGAANVKKIAASFQWTHFGPVVVSPVEGGKYSIVDGQHRVTAAKIRGIRSVPCMIIIADRTQQAAAFRAINTVTTSMSPLALYHAEIIAGSKEAAEIKAICDRAGVTVLRSNRVTADMKPGQTTAIKALKQGLRLYGRDVLTLALRCITETKRNRPGAISAINVAAICLALHSNAKFRENEPALLRRFDYCDVEEFYKEACFETEQKEGQSRIPLTAQKICGYLDQRLFGFTLEKAHA